mgnify:CR=1 FL=1
MLQKIDDFLIDKVFQKIADFMFSYFGLSGIRIANYLLPLSTTSFCWFIVIDGEMSVIDSLILGVTLCLSASWFAVEKRNLEKLEKLLLDGARNIKRIHPSFVFFRSAWSVLTVFDVLIMSGVLQQNKFTIVSTLFFFQLYFDATDINPPKKKKSFKLSLEPQ